MYILISMISMSLDFHISMSLTLLALILGAKEKNNYNSETKDIKIDCAKNLHISVTHF